MPPYFLNEEGNLSFSLTNLSSIINKFGNVMYGTFMSGKKKHESKRKKKVWTHFHFVFWFK